MQFSDTSTKQGLLQDCEFWCGLPDGSITGSTYLKAAFTRLINIEYAKTLAKLQLISREAGAEDTNYTDQQFALFDIDEGVNSYQFLTDAGGNTITDITGVLILPSATAADFEPLEKLMLDRSEAQLIMSPNTSNTGVPSGYIETNNTIFFDTLPSYSKTGGGKLFYHLVPSYFATSDTTKEPGFVESAHPILSVGASLKWLSVNKQDQTNLIATARAELATLMADFESYTRMKNPTRARLTGANHSTR